MAKDPTEVIRKAVMRMLPRNKLRDVSEFHIYLFIRIAHRFIFFLVQDYMLALIVTRILCKLDFCMHICGESSAY